MKLFPKPSSPLAPSPSSRGYALLSLVLVIIIIFILIFIPLQLISVFNTRSASSSTNARVAFYGTESAIHDAISRLIQTKYAWPGIGQTAIDNLNFSGVAVTRTTIDNANNTYSVDAVGAYKQINRHLTANISSNSQSSAVDVAIVIDNSGSMNNISGTPCDGASQPVCQPLDDARKAAKFLIDEFINNSTDAQVSIFKFSDYATKITSLSNNLSAAKTAIDSIRTSGGTNIGDGFYQASLELQTNGRPKAYSFIVLLTDGGATIKGVQGSTSSCNGGTESPIHNACTDTGDPQSAITRAQVAKQNGITLFTVGLGVSNFPTVPGTCTIPPCGIQAVARDTLIQSATDPKHYYEAPNSSDLQNIFIAIAQEIIKSPSFQIQEVGN